MNIFADDIQKILYKVMEKEIDAGRYSNREFETMKNSINQTDLEHRHRLMCRLLLQYGGAYLTEQQLSELRRMEQAMKDNPGGIPHISSINITGHMNKVREKINKMQKENESTSSKQALAMEVLKVEYTAFREHLHTAKVIGMILAESYVDKSVLTKQLKLVIKDIEKIDKEPVFSLEPV
jgi:HPt (histidine-containing phosphotransfer) domain-containing protein